GLSIIVISPAAAVTQVTGGGFVALLVGLTAVSGAILFWRCRRGFEPVWPWTRPYARTTLLSLIIVPALFFAILTPKFYWENFNGDGAHAFEAARLLLRQPFPFWPGAAGAVAGFPGMTSMLFLYPVSWFIRLFGPVEVAARIPFLLFWLGLFAGVVAVVEKGRKETVRPSIQWLIWLGLLVYAVTMAFSASYSPYLADIALPATQDTLQIALFLGFVLAFLRRDAVWLFLFAGMTITCSPAGLLLIGFWLAAVFLVQRPIPWRWLVVAGGMTAVILAITVVTTPLLARLGQPVPGDEYGSTGILRRFATLNVADWRRILYLLLPGGIAPGLALLAWRWQDSTARALTLVTAAYFGFFYIQGTISLHHFSPVMALPLVVLWRLDVTGRPAIHRWLLPGTAAAGLVALFLSLPPDFTPHTQARQVGKTIQFEVAGYDDSQPQVFLASELLNELFPPAWETAVPATQYGGSPLVWNYYAHQPKTGETAVNYILQPASDPLPAGMTLVAKRSGAALYVADESVWQAQLALRPSTDTLSPIYFIHKSTLYRGVP
ncbi:MAG: hypothetical protein ACE5EY_17280, partial [Anaerolineae bacterium]